MKNYSSLLSICLFLIACDGSEPAPVDKDQLSEVETGAGVPMNSTVAANGSFTSFAHSLGGNAALYTDAQGMKTLRFENFNMTEGPDVYVMVSKANNYSEANTIPVAMLKGSFTGTSLNVKLDNSIDLATHKFVLVYCVQFSSLFGYSELKP
jgi:hypothetical protein